MAFVAVLGLAQSSVGVRPVVCASSRRRWSMCSGRPPIPEKGRKKPSRMPYVSKEMGLEAQAEAIRAADGDVMAVADMCAFGVAEALSQSYAEDTHPSIFVVAGSGFNGLVGARAAILLQQKGYRTTVYVLAGSAVASSTGMIDTCDMLKKAGMTTCDFAPATVDYYYDVLLDALLGVGFNGGDIGQQYWQAFELLLRTERPIVSVDVPSGWDLDSGPRKVDARAGTFMRPDVLVSLGVPKDGTKTFAGGFHFVGGRHVPRAWLDAREVSLPAWPGNAACALLSSNPFPDKGNVGEAYGKPGMFEATLWDGYEGRKRWVSDEEMIENDLWDELD